MTKKSLIYKSTRLSKLKIDNFDSIFLFKNKAFVFPLILLITVFILAFFKISGSSIGEYNEYFYGSSYKDPNLIFGQARSIRSDEWIVETPLTLSQKDIDFKSINKLVGLGQDTTLLGDAPNLHWSTTFQPQNWSYFALPLENAFAFEWWIRGLLLILGAYLFLYKLTKGDFLLSVGGSLIVFLTPFVQWWYSTTAVESITYLFFILFSFMKILGYKNFKELIFYTVVLIYFSIAFLLILYPPFLIPLMLLIISFSLGYFINLRKQLGKRNLPPIALSLTTTLITTGLVTFFYYLSSKELIQVIQNTVYPGSREVFGGGFTFSQFFSGFYNFLLQRNREIPPVLGNQSEASSGLFLFIFILPVLLFFTIKNFLLKKNLDFVLISLISFMFFLVTWMILGLPEIFSKVTLLVSSTPIRAVIALVVLNIILVFYFLSRIRIDINLSYKITTYMIAALAAFLVFSIGFYFKATFPDLNDNLLVLIIASFGVFLMVTTLLLQRKVLFVTFTLGYLFISSFIINPLYVGLEPLRGSQLSETIRKIDTSDSGDFRWIAYDSVIMPNYLVGTGVNSLNGVHLYPQFDLWETIDPESKSKPIWNRYAHIQFKTNAGGQVEFNLDQADLFTVMINPCNPTLNKLNVRYFVFEKEVSYSCLTKENKIQLSSKSIFIYKKVN